MNEILQLGIIVTSILISLFLISMILILFVGCDTMATTCALWGIR